MEDHILMKRTDANVMGNDFARRNMWDTDYRPEQQFARDFLAIWHPNLSLNLEYGVKNLKIDDKSYRKCRLDIAIPKEMIAIRLNGGYHRGQQSIKDEFQKVALQQAGWVVIDFDFYKMPNLFKKKKSEETVKLAKEEIVKQFGKMSLV